MMPYRADQATIQGYIDRSRAAGVSDVDTLDYLRNQAPKDIRDFYGKSTQLFDLEGQRAPSAGPAPSAPAPQPSWPAYLLREGEIGLGNFAAGLAGIPARLGAPTPSTEQLASYLPQPATPEEHALAAGARSAGTVAPSMLYPPVGIPATIGAFTGGVAAEEVAQRTPFKSPEANQLAGIAAGALAGGGLSGGALRLAGYATSAASAGMRAAAHGAFGTAVGELAEVALRHFGGLGPGLSQIAAFPIGIGAALMGRGGAMPFSKLGAAAGGGSALMQGPAPNPLAPSSPSQQGLQLLPK